MGIKPKLSITFTKNIRRLYTSPQKWSFHCETLFHRFPFVPFFIGIAISFPKKIREVTERRGKDWTGPREGTKRRKETMFLEMGDQVK